MITQPPALSGASCCSSGADPGLWIWGTSQTMGSASLASISFGVCMALLAGGCWDPIPPSQQGHAPPKGCCQLHSCPSNPSQQAPRHNCKRSTHAYAGSFHLQCHPVVHRWKFGCILCSAWKTALKGPQQDGYDVIPITISPSLGGMQRWEASRLPASVVISLSTAWDGQICCSRPPGYP